MSIEGDNPPWRQKICGDRAKLKLYVHSNYYATAFFFLSHKPIYIFNHKPIYLCVYEGCKRKVVKEVCEIFPDICVAIFPQALVIEAINLCDLSALVVSPQYRDAFWIANLQMK